jgi:uncharacterized protein (DUF1800 family)
MSSAEATPARNPPEVASDPVRLVRRVTQGVTSEEVARARTLGHEQYLDYQLDFTRIDDGEAEAFVSRNYPALALPTAQIHVIPQPTLIQTLQEATLYRAAFSKRQLYERMVEFWSDHFNIAIDKVGVNKIEDDRDVIRKHALGNFGDLLRASSRSTAMLGFLDQYTSRAGNPNENYARELMELHTVGIDGGYAQRDVAGLSRVLTGWTFERAWGGHFVFDPAIHDWDAKRVMKLAIPAGAPSSGAAGMTEGERVVELLLAHPSTGRFLAAKLIKWLLTPTPTEAQIATVAHVYAATRGDIKSMVRATLDQAWLREAPPKYKRPAHFVASALRSLAPTVNGMATANACLAETGQELFKWETPDGYPDTLEYWVGNLLPRWKVANRLVAEQSSTQFHVDVSAYQGGSPEAAVARMDRELFGGEVPDATRTRLLAYLSARPADEIRIRETLALALSTPAFQWY